MTATLLVACLAAAPAATPERVEAQAAVAAQACAAGQASGLRGSLEALRLTTEFEPTVYVQAGRKGEVVEDEFLAARQAYRVHRSRLYVALGECLLSGGRPAEAVRVLRRAELLGDEPGSRALLARALLAAGQPDELLRLVLAHSAAGLSPDLRPLAEKAADAAGLASLQVELDRARLLALPAGQRPELREGPLAEPQRARLSTGAPFRWAEAELTLAYVADAACASCSSDLEALARLAPRQARVVIAAEDPDRDEALRRVLSLYSRPWPVVTGVRLAQGLGVQPPVLVVAGRGGLLTALVSGRLGESLPAVLAVLGREDLAEARPRPAWSRRPFDRTPRALPGWLPEGLAPPEVDPPPPAFAAAREAFAAGRFTEALAAFERLDNPAEAVLLPPEARLNRALCLIALGRRDEARRVLLRIGDSRFQEEVDRVLESPAK